ncbi:MAG: TonB-dependent receptor [Melioribacteraceae bacterium]
MSKMYKLTLLILLLVSSFVFAQKTYKVSGKVTSQQTGEELIGANVYVKGLAIGAAADVNGNYEFKVPEGSYTIVCSYIGFEAAQLLNVNVTNNMDLDFELKDYAFSLSVEVIADRARERETPVAFTNIDKKEVEFKLGSQDVPMVLNTTPSVYATQQGGGAGDARVNMRGFNQRNIAIMINGVPVNDMENGWVYWSNWDGVGDAVSSMQIQRGLSAVNLAVASVGGTMNVITDPTAASFGGKFKQEIGNDGFFKSTIAVNSGVIDDKFAVSAVLVKKQGNGLIDKAWTDAMAYYFGASYNINASNRVELYALGAPQRHGQNLYRQNAAAYSHDYAKNVLGYSEGALNKFKEVGRTFNQNWAPVNSSYAGQQWSYGIFSSKGGAIDRYDSEFISERENFFHKPIVNLNWYSVLADDLSLYTTAYWSGGHGGGTGAFGKIHSFDANGKVGGENYKFYYGQSPWTRDWNTTIAMNSGAAGDYYVDKSKLTKEDGQSLGILRNSRNDQWTYGLISKAFYKVSDNFKASFGVDTRIAEIDHYRQVRDLLGGQFYLYTGNDFDTPEQQKKRLGDKLAFDFTNTVGWLGGFLQGEYTEGDITAYGTGGVSTINYTYTNHFKKAADGNEVFTETDNIFGYQVKGGASYRLTSNLSFYSNAGLVSKVPIFDAVINDVDGSKAENPENEKFASFEAGLNFKSSDGKVAVNANVYHTTWLDRSLSVNTQNLDGTEALVFLKGLDQRHIGVEVEIALMPIRELNLNVVASFGDWKNISDVDAEFKSYDSGTEIIKTFNLYTNNLKVGDQPQTSLVFSATTFPVKGLSLSAIVRHYRDYYSNWNVTGRTNPNDRSQSWKAPNYTVMDFHSAYNLPLELSGVSFQLFAHVFNILDEIYVQDATDNSRFNAYTGNGKAHAADDAEIFFGLPRTFNAGISVMF